MLIGKITDGTKKKKHPTNKQTTKNQNEMVNFLFFKEIGVRVFSKL